MHHQVSANCIGLDPTMCITATSPGVSDSHLLCMLRVFSGLGAPYAMQPRFSIAQAKVIEITVEAMYITIGCKANNLSKRSIFFIRTHEDRNETLSASTNSWFFGASTYLTPGDYSKRPKPSIKINKLNQLSYKVCVEWQCYVTDAESSQSCQQGCWLEKKMWGWAEFGFFKRFPFYFSLLHFWSWVHINKSYLSIITIIHIHITHYMKSYVDVVTIKRLPLKKKKNVKMHRGLHLLHVKVVNCVQPLIFCAYSSFYIWTIVPVNPDLRVSLTPYFTSLSTQVELRKYFYFCWYLIIKLYSSFWGQLCSDVSTALGTYTQQLLQSSITGKIWLINPRTLNDWLRLPKTQPVLHLTAQTRHPCRQYPTLPNHIRTAPLKSFS